MQDFATDKAMFVRALNQLNCFFEKSRKAVLIMKLTGIIILAACLQVSAKGVSQTVTISVKEVPLITVLTEIRKQTGYSFFADNKQLEKAKKISLSVNNIPLLQVLETCFKDQPLSYTIIDKVINVYPKKESSHESGVSIQTEFEGKDINGIITDENGTPIQGVNVLVKGTNRGTTTNLKGEFAIKNVELNATLVVSSVGYNKLEVPVSEGGAFIRIQLKIAVGNLDELQVIAYGTTSKRFNTGNVATVKGEDIQRQPVNNPILALQGRVPGLTITQATGVAGGAVNIRIQGRNNLNPRFTGSDPLIVIDGIPFPSQNLLTFWGGKDGGNVLGQLTGANGTPGSTLSLVNPEDIESIDVLKDADATAIYGSRAANGAILITTKKGKAKDTKIDISIQSGWGQVPRKLKLLNTQDYLEMRKEAFKNDNLPIPSITTSPNNSRYDINGLWDISSYTDWQKKLIGGKAGFTRATTSIKGGNSNTNYLIGGTWSKETSVFPGDFENTRGSIHFNINSSSTNKRFQIQLTGSFLADNNNPPGVDYTRFIFLAPNAPALYNTDGTLNWAPNPSGVSSWTNPLSFNYNLFENKSTNLIGNSVLSYQILPGFEIRTSLGYNQLSSDQFLGSLDLSYKPEQRQSLTRSSVFTKNIIKSWIAEPQLNYKKTIGKKGKLDAIVGLSFQKAMTDGIATSSYGQSSDLLLKNLASATSFSQETINSVYNYNAVFGRLNYIFDSRYVLNLSGRRDGSSRFGINNLFQNFAAVGTGWIFSEEKFIRKTLPFLSFGKLRASYGITGNDQIGDYLFMSLYGSTLNPLPYQNLQGLQDAGIINPDLQWEETKKLQAGLDLGFENDRFVFSVNYFRNRTSNNLNNIPLPITTGTTNYISNLSALIQNSGWEFSVRADNVKGGDLFWSTNINLTIPRNRLVEFPGLETSAFADLYILGRPLSIIKEYSFYGVDPTSGQYLVRDVNGNPTSNPDYVTDRLALLNIDERFYGGLQNSIGYKGLQLDFLFQFTKQMGYDFTEINTPGAFSANSPFANQPIGVFNRWQKPGDVTSTSKFTTSFASAIYGDRSFKDVSFIRLKNISLSYNFPEPFCKRLRMNQGKVFINAQNLLTITSYHGLDPETKSVTTLPPLRVITFGIQISL